MDCQSRYIQYSGIAIYCFSNLINIYSYSWSNTYIGANYWATIVCITVPITIFKASVAINYFRIKTAIMIKITCTSEPI